MNTSPRRRPPLWFVIIIIVMIIPIVMWPFALINYDAEDTSHWWIVNIFPIYALLSCYLAYKCYISRREMSYILLIVLLLAYLSTPFLL